jgi:hypothetical protein
MSIALSVNGRTVYPVHGGVGLGLGLEDAQSWGKGVAEGGRGEVMLAVGGHGQCARKAERTGVGVSSRSE